MTGTAKIRVLKIHPGDVLLGSTTIPSDLFPVTVLYVDRCSVKGWTFADVLRRGNVYNMTLINDEEIEVLGPVVGMRTGEQRAATR